MSSQDVNAMIDRLDEMSPAAARHAHALQRFGGNIAAAARHLRISRTAVNLMIERHPLLKELCQTFREAAVDDAETNIYAAARRGDVNACKAILLNTKEGRARGWSSHYSVDADVDMNVRVVVVATAKASDDESWERSARADLEQVDREIEAERRAANHRVLPPSGGEKR